MLMLTLDTNCIVALDRDEQPHSSCLRDLLELHSAGMVTLRLTAMSASEKQPNKSYLKDFSKFQERIERLGLEQLELLKPICYFDVSFWGWWVFGGGEASELDKRIHHILFPSEPVELREAVKGMPDGQNTSLMEATWRNHKCDVLAMWCHIHYGGDIFVTTDRNFMKASRQQRLKALGAGEIQTPCGALSLVRKTPSVQHRTV